MDTQTTCANLCYEMREHVFIYTTKWSNQLTEGAALKTKCDLIIWHPPFWDYDTVIYYDKLLGMYAVMHYNNRVHGQSGSTVPRSPGSGILVPCGHGQIFMAAQVWHGMSQTLVSGHSSEQLAWHRQLEPVSSGLLVLRVQQMWAACVVQVGVMQVVMLRSGG